jgi:hypothetical protein
MINLDKIKSYEKALETVCANGYAVATEHLYSFEYDMDGKAVNMLVVCSEQEAEEFAADLGLRLLGTVAVAKLYKGNK